MISDDHDLLIKINENLNNFIRTTGKHIEADDIRFDSIRKDKEFTTKVIYMGFGAIFVLNIILRVFFK